MSYSHLETFPAKLPGRDYLYQPFTIEQWNKSSFASEADLKWFKDAKYGMFIHFGLSTYQKGDLSWDICYTRKAPDFGHGPVADEEWKSWGDHFKLENFDANKYVEIAKASGFKYIVVVAKHHDGFHMWDTDESEFKVTNTPFGRDFVKELIDACHQAEMPVGVYYSQRDWYHPDYMPVAPQKIEKQTGVNWTLKAGETSPIGDEHWKYVAYQERVVRELCTRYGKLDVFWWDALWWGGMFTADMWDAERINKVIRELQPGIIINNRCSIPGDFDTPEKRLGAFQNWRPWESCVCLTDTWSYSGALPKSFKDLVAMLTMTICGDGNLLMSWGPHWDGRFDDKEIDALTEVGQWLSQYNEAVYGTRGGPWKPGPWGGAVYRGNTVFLHIIAIHDNKLSLPKLPNRQVLTASVFNTEIEVEFAEVDGQLHFTIPKDIATSPSLILSLTIDCDVDQLDAIDSTEPSAFMDICAYGYAYKGRLNIQDNTSANQPNVEIDFTDAIKLTAVSIQFDQFDAAQEVHLYTSIDGFDWTDWGAVSKQRSDIEITCYEAGAWIPGLDIRYVKLQANSGSAFSLANFTCFAR